MTQEERETPDNGGAMRFNTGKPQWSLVDFPSLEPMVRVLEFGAQKYARDNWKQGLYVNKICDSLLRHTFALLSGEDNDPESGMPHVGHIQCNAMFLAYMLKNRPDLDDRPSKQTNQLTIEFHEDIEPTVS